MYNLDILGFKIDNIFYIIYLPILFVHITNCLTGHPNPNIHHGNKYAVYLYQIMNRNNYIHRLYHILLKECIICKDYVQNNAKVSLTHLILNNLFSIIL